jgi:ligand-binding sensor domain-containing protein
MRIRSKKKFFLQTQAFTFLSLFIFSASCNAPAKKDLPREKRSESKTIAAAHPKLIKTIGNPRYGNVQCGVQDKAGNLWFGTTQNGLYKYDGKSFIQFLVTDGLNSNNVYSLLEDKDDKIWIGTEAGLCLYDPSATLRTGGRKFTKIQIPLPKNLPPNNNSNYLNSHWVYSIMQDRSGKLWFVTIDGVYVYDGKSFTLFPINTNSILG